MNGMILKVWKSSHNVQQQKILKPQEQALPNQICGRILDLQFQTQKQSLQKQTVVELLDLYSQAVQFYQERENPKYKSYQKRMQSFLKRPDIQLIMKGADSQFHSYKKRQTHQAQIQKAAQCNQIVAQKIIEGTQVKAQKQKSIIQQSLSYQDTQLQQRIVRRRSNSNRSVKSIDLNVDNQNKLTKNSSQKKWIKQDMNINILLEGIQTRQRRKVFL